MAKTLLDTVMADASSVLDPFMGGGTVLVEAMRAGRRAYGSDVSPMALWVSTYHTMLLEDDALGGPGREPARAARTEDEEEEEADAEGEEGPRTAWGQGLVAAVDRVISTAQRLVAVRPLRRRAPMRAAS